MMHPTFAHFRSLPGGFSPAVCIAEELHVSQIHLRIKAERQRGFRPVQYENQYLRGYHWWLFPNYIDGIYSKVYARINIAGDLVVGTGKSTRLVCIENGRLTLSPFISDNAVSASDTRLLVCL